MVSRIGIRSGSGWRRPAAGRWATATTRPPLRPRGPRPGADRPFDASRPPTYHRHLARNPSPTATVEGDSHGMTSIAARPAPPLADTPLGRTIATTATDIWNDSCSIPELEYAISYGAVGATANPTIVTDVWKQDPTRWQSRVRDLARERPVATETELAWAIVEEMSIAGARLLEPAFESFGGRQGRLSVQTDPTLYRTPDAMLAQGIHFTTMAPNIIVKF